MNRFSLHFAAFLGSASAVALVLVAGISFACQSARAAMGSDKGPEMRFTPASRPQDGLSHPVNTGHPTGGKPADLRRATRGVAAGSPGLERSSVSFNHHRLQVQDGRGLGEARLVSAQGLRTLATSAANLCGVPVAIFHALIHRESSWRPWVVSSSGAVGLGQIKPSTLRDIDPTLNAWEPWDNLLGSACYLRQQFDRFGTWRKALHAYHGGPNRRVTVQATHDYATDIIEASN